MTDRKAWPEEIIEGNLVSNIQAYPVKANFVTALSVWAEALRVQYFTRPW